MGKDFSIQKFSFNKPFNDNNLLNHEMGENWPVVYLLLGKEDIYVGETSNAVSRMRQHSDPNGSKAKERAKLDEVRIVFDPTFNKSAILDI